MLKGSRYWKVLGPGRVLARDVLDTGPMFPLSLALALAARTFSAHKKIFANKMQHKRIILDLI